MNQAEREELQIKLSEAAIKALPVPEAGNEVTYFAGDKLQGKIAPAGFGVRVTAGGSRAFVLNYRVAGRERRYTIGDWQGTGGAWSVIAAVDEALKLRKQVDKGNDPQQAKDDSRATSPASKRVSDLLDDWLARYVNAKDHPLRTAHDIERALERLVKPAIGKLGIYELRRSHVVEMLDTIEDENGPVMADRTLAYVRKAFTWYAARDDQFNLPIVRGMARTKPKERARQRILADDEIRDVWAALDQVEKPSCYARFVRSLLLTAQRRNEVAKMQWPEIDGETWIIPAERYKTKIENVVPLSKSASDVIGTKPEPRKGRDGRPLKQGPYVFSTTDGHEPFGGYSKAKRDLDAKVAEIRKKGGRGPIAPWVLHDLRRTGRSLMSRAGVPSDIAERVLGHVIPGVRGTYDRHAYFDEKRDALEKLAAMLDRILHPPAGNVASFDEERARRSEVVN